MIHRFRLAFIFSFLFVLCIVALNASEFTIGSGDQSNYNIPISMTWQNNLFECLYYQEELGIVSGNITGIAFYNNFTDISLEKPFNIWLGTTASSDLSGGWIPSTSLTQVFSGNLSLPVALNTINVPFTNPFPYNGGNLVLLVERVMDTVYYSSSNNFFCQTIGNSRSLSALSDSDDFDPANPPGVFTLSGIFPQTTFYYTGQGIANDLTCLSVAGNRTPCPESTWLYTVKVKNNGCASQDGYTVKLMKTGDVEIGSVIGTTINEAQTLSFTIPWAPEYEQNTYLYAKVISLGDQYPSNDKSPELLVFPKPAGTNMTSIGDPNFRNNSRIPVDMYRNTSLYECLYYPEEIGLANKYITDLEFYNNFESNLMDKPTQIWMGTTSLADLSGGYIPANDLTLVFDGLVDYPSGYNDVKIELTSPFFYPGANLVVMVLRPFDVNNYPNGDVFNASTGRTNRALKTSSYSEILDPYNPPVGTIMGLYPRIGLYYVDQVIYDDLACLGLTGASYPTAGTEYEYNITIKNEAYDPQTNYSIKLMQGGIELASVLGNPISPMETQEYTLNWIPSTVGISSIYGQVVLLGDETPDNNQSESLAIEVQSPGSVAISIGSGAARSSAPMNFGDYNTSIYECIFLANEIGASGMISQVKFNYDFTYSRYNKSIKIWLGVTGQNDLAAGYIPSTSLSLVFDGNLNIPAGIGTLSIPLQSPFAYTGGNLVMMVFRPWDTQTTYWGNYFIGDYANQDSAYDIVSSTNPLDPADLNPTAYLTWFIPNTTFILEPISSSPLLSTYPTNVDFGATRIGGTYTQNLWTTNIGPSPLVIESINVSGSGYFVLQNLPQFPFTMGAMVSMAFDIQYLPSSYGIHNATINIIDNTGRSVHTITITGECLDLTVYSMPYQQDFDSLPAPALPLDWVGWVETEGDAYVRSFESSDNYYVIPYSEPNSLVMDNMQNSNIDCILIGPKISESIDINDVILSFYAIQSSQNLWISIGFVSDYDHPESFQYVSDKRIYWNWNQYYVDLSNYSGNNRHIAFRVSYYGQHIVLDDIKLTYEVELPQLLSPNGDEVWTGGATEIIRWEPTDLNLTLQISYDGGNNWGTILNQTSQTDRYYYTVPAANSNQCMIRIGVYESPTFFDQSDSVFRIQSNPSLPKVLMTYPNAQDLKFGVDEPVTLKWIRTNVSSVSLDLSNDEGSSWQRFASGVDADSLVWSVMDMPGRYCLIRVSPDTHPLVMDMTDYPFAIGKIQILSPQVGDIVYCGYNYAVDTQVHLAGVNDIQTEYSIDGGETWVNAGRIGGYPADATYNVGMYFRGIPSNNYYYRVSAYDKPSILDISGPFELRNPIKLTNANGGGFVTRNAPFAIRWENQQVEPDWTIFWEYSYNGEVWTRINTIATPIGAESFIWTANLNLDDSVWLRAVNNLDWHVIGQSEAPLVVTNKNLTLWSPSGGEQYLPQSTQTIYWEGSGLSTLNIDYSIDNGINWIRIASNVPAAQNSIQWTIPDTPSDLCLLKLSDTTYGYMNRFSDTCFAILPIPNIPEISLTSSNTINFNTVYLGDTSEPQYIQVMNSGTGTLIIDAVTFYHPDTEFGITGTSLPLEILPQSSAQIGVVFVPSTSVAVNDSIYIHSNAVNLPVLGIKLSGTGEYVPPAAVLGVEVNIVGNDAVINWLPVTETIYGSPITPDFYIVLYNETPYTDSQYYYYLTYTPTLSATHLGVALFRDQMFYRVVAYKSYRDEEIAVFREMSVAPDKKRWSDVLYKLSEISVRAIVMEE